MKRLWQVGIIGADARAEMLADPLWPSRRSRIAGWAAGPDDEAAAAALAGRIGLTLTPTWEAIAADPNLDALLVLGSDHRDAVLAGLAAGKTVLWPSAAIYDRSDWNRIASLQATGGRLFAPGELRFTPAGRYTLDRAVGGELGKLHSVYIGLRAPRSSARTAAISLLREGLEFALGMAPEPVRRIHAVAQSLFGDSKPDTVVCTLRFADDLVVTIEASQCLPATIPAGGPAEAEIEVVGALEVVRAEPYKTPVHRFGDQDHAVHPWVSQPVRVMLDALGDHLDGAAQLTDGAGHQARIADLMEAIRSAAADGLGSWNRA